MLMKKRMRSAKRVHQYNVLNETDIKGMNIKQSVTALPTAVASKFNVQAALL